MQAFQSTQLRGVLVVLAAMSHVAAQAPASNASAALVRSTPEREGISSAAILRFVAARRPKDGEERNGLVWSAAHGHWHNKYGGEAR